MKVTFTPLIAGKPWCGATIYEQALGGSEKCVVYLARELARRGHEVTVYTHGQPGNFEGVSYQLVQALQAAQVPSCDVHVSSRWVEILGIVPCEKRVLWLHDMPQPINVSGIPCDDVVCISKFQRDAWGFREEDPSVHVIGDGVDLTLFTGREDRRENQLLWISNPDRGLYIACEVFRNQILPRWPEMEFHVYGRYSVYGWPAAAERWFLPPPSWLGKNIFLHDPLPSLGIARELMRSWALFYPTFWPEVFCMAALEAQAAGTPVISSPIAALPETIMGGILTNDLVNAVSQLRNKNRWKKLSKTGKEFAATHDWALLAERWEKEVFDV